MPLCVNMHHYMYMYTCFVHLMNPLFMGGGGTKFVSWGWTGFEGIAVLGVGAEMAELSGGGGINVTLSGGLTCPGGRPSSKGGLSWGWVCPKNAAPPQDNFWNSPNPMRSMLNVH